MNYLDKIEKEKYFYEIVLEKAKEVERLIKESRQNKEITFSLSKGEMPTEIWKEVILYLRHKYFISDYNDTNSESCVFVTVPIFEAQRFFSSITAFYKNEKKLFISTRNDLNFLFNNNYFLILEKYEDMDKVFKPCFVEFDQTIPYKDFDELFFEAEVVSRATKIKDLNKKEVDSSVIKFTPVSIIRCLEEEGQDSIEIIDLFDRIK